MKKIKLGQLKMGAIISYFSMAFSIVAGLVYTPWMVDKIGKSDYGLYTLANSLIMIFVMDFGLGSAVSRFVAKYRAEGRKEDISNILGVIYKLYIIIDVAILAVLVGVYLFVDQIYDGLTPSELETFRTLYIIVAGYHIAAFPFMPLNGILNAYEKFIQLKICDLVYKVFSVVSVVIVLLFSESVIAVITANVLTHMAVVVLKFIFVKVYVPEKVNMRASGRNIYKTLFSFTLWTTIIAIMQRFTHSFAPSVLGMTSSSHEIALYAPAVTLEGYFFTFGQAINGLFLPRVSKFIAEKQEDKILQLMIKVGRYQAIVLGWIFIGFACVGSDFMTLWMGKDFKDTYYLALIILLPTLISSTQQIAKTTVIAKKLINYQALCMTVTGVLGLGASYLMSKHIGAMGVCIGTAATSIANITFMNFVYKKKAGINVFEFYKKCYLMLVPCYGITIAAGLLIAKYVPLSGWVGLGAKAGLITLVFAVITLVFYTTKAEKKMILKKLKLR